MDTNTNTSAPEEKPAAPVVIDDTDLLDPVDVEVKAEDAPPEPEKPEAPVDNKPEPDKPAPILPIRQRASQYKQRAETAEAENARLYEKLKTAEDVAASRDVVNLTLYDQNVTSAMATAKQAVKEAVMSGDAEKIAEANAQLAVTAAKKAQLDTWKESQPAAEARPEPRPEPAPRAAAAAPPPNERLVAWVKANPWFDGNSDQFSQDMAEEAVAFSHTVERRLKRDGVAEPWTDQRYWDAIDQHVRAEFPDEFIGAAQPEQRPAARRSAVAPVTPSAPASQPTPNRPKVNLTSEQRGMARMMSLSHPNGTPMTDAEKEYEYAKGVLVSQRREAERRASGRL